MKIHCLGNIITLITDCCLDKSGRVLAELGGWWTELVGCGQIMGDGRQNCRV